MPFLLAFIYVFVAVGVGKETYRYERSFLAAIIVALLWPALLTIAIGEEIV